MYNVELRGEGPPGSTESRLALWGDAAFATFPGQAVAGRFAIAFPSELGTHFTGPAARESSFRRDRTRAVGRVPAAVLPPAPLRHTRLCDVKLLLSA